MADQKLTALTADLAPALADWMYLVKDSDITSHKVTVSNLLALVPSAALTKTDDTNVTLTLGGTPATALLQAVSLTLGWSGQLSIARGGTSLSAAGHLLNATLWDDVTAGVVARGDVITGQGAAAKWARLAKGTANQVLAMDGTATDVVWATPASVTPAALTKTDDTNVTLTLGGTPASALLQATSLTLGWTGTLATARGGTGTATPTAVDWLTQYALLAGRAGGQTVNGGTAASENLILQATANATQGYVKFEGGAGTLTLRHNTASATSIRHVYSVNGTDLWDSFWDANGYSVRDIAGGGFKSPFTFQAGCPAGAFVITPTGTTVLGHLGVGVGPDPTIETFISTTRNVTNILAGSLRVQNTGSTNPSAMINLIAGSGGAAGFSFAVGAAHFDFSSVNDCAAFAIRDTGFNQIVLFEQGAGANALVVKAGGNIGIGVSAFPGTGTLGLIFADGTALSSMGSNTAGLYADDISGNVSMHAINENGDLIKLIKTNTYTQTYSTADRTLSAYIADPESGAYSGIDNAQAGTPYAQLADLNALRVAYENLRAFAEDIAGMLNGAVDDLQTIGHFG
jgi:hypothetical protein